MYTGRRWRDGKKEGERESLAETEIRKKRLSVPKHRIYFRKFRANLPAQREKQTFLLVLFHPGDW